MAQNNKNMVISSHSSVLKEYYVRYLSDVRKVSTSTVKHYLDALNNISRRLKAIGLVKEEIYEITDLDALYAARDVVYNDHDFIQLNERGNHMYSSAMNHYCKFAEGKDFGSLQEKLKVLDIPIEREESKTVNRKQWKRSSIIRTQVIEMANYQCELNPNHQSFIAQSNHKPYMEGHHTLPLSYQEKCDSSLDVYANVVCLCPLCHRKIHYGLRDERVKMIGYIYDKRVNRLMKSGISLGRDKFIDAAIEFSDSSNSEVR